ncbi:MAG: gamma-glutamyltransferase [Rhodobacteraceae bacterium]|nr:gamma-glutamyltransferase [Paracoccaceae bacterium]
MTAIIAGLALATAATAQDVADSVAPEGATATGGQITTEAIAAARADKEAGRPVQAQNWMVAAANPLAVQAGADILAAGGTAADAFVAVQAVLGLVEPQSSGLGGGGFLLWYDAAAGQLTTLDGRETAPLAATPRLFQTDDGAPMGFFDAVVGGLSVGVPGTPMLMEEAHRRWGRTEWPRLFDAAIAHAEDGFAVSARMGAMVAGDAERLGIAAATAAYFLPGGAPLAAGEVLTNPAYAASLRALAADGADAFYTGPIAAEIVAAVRSSAKPGLLSEFDMALYQVKERAPACAAYRVYVVCGMGPPSSGGLTVGQILGTLNSFDLAGLGPDDPETWRLIGDASRLAFADRGRYMADSDFVPVPTQGLVAPAYLQSRASLLETDSALDAVAPGTPEFDHALNWADDVPMERPSTTHVSIVDGYGNALSMTSSVENAFGSRLMAGGFLLNNQLTDFSFRSHSGGVPIANRMEPGKRPRSSMSPTIVLQDGAPVLVIGSPGGSRIIGYVAQAIIAWADWDMDVQAALSMPHGVNRFGTFDLEAGTSAEALAEPLTTMGFETNIRDLNSGLHAIEIGPSLSGGADPRREGIALGG